jgi:Leishmanolysin
LWADYPGIAVDEEAIYVTNNMFPNTGSGFGGSFLWILDKTSFYTTNDSNAWKVFNLFSTAPAGTFQPAMVRATTGIPGNNVGTYLVTHVCADPPGVGGFVTIRINNPLPIAPPTTTLVRSDVINTNQYLCGLQDAPQSGSTGLIETNDPRALEAVWVNNVLWVTFTVRESANGQTAAWYARLSANGVNAPALLDQSVINGEDISAGAFTFFPSLDVNSAGVAAFGFSASSPTIFGGAYATIRNLDGSFETSEFVKEGEGPYFIVASGRNRWGDYTGMALDPVDDNCFWAFNQYARADTCVSTAGIQNDEVFEIPFLDPSEFFNSNLGGSFELSSPNVNATNPTSKGATRRLQATVGCWSTAWACLCAPPQPPTPAPAVFVCPSNEFQFTTPDFGVNDDNDFNLWVDLEVSSETVRSFYNSAHARWTSIITGDSNPPRSSAFIPPEQRGPAGPPALLDDLYIYGADTCIDGLGKVLGQAGPTFVDSTSKRPVSGIMQFDRDDIAAFINQFEEIILHEMAHVLGIGSLWDPSLFNFNVNGLYTGAQGLDVWQNTFGCTGPLRIENDGGGGAAGGHWEEDDLRTELMTGFLNSGVDNQLSELTIAALGDMGYTVDYDVADEVSNF